MFRKMLIANRGEIALRIIRACREAGISSVAVYSEADTESLHVSHADIAICIGPPPPTESYLKSDRIIAAAEIADVDAIHPGYGFLAEDANFAEMCRSCNIAFVGPSPETIAKVGNKVEAREIAKRCGVPVLPGSDGAVRSREEALEMAHKVGYPVIIKAAAGGGGRGMRIAHNDISLSSLLLTAQSEAEAAFGDGAIYIEKYLEEPRHVEIQVLADKHGRYIHLGERDCTVQRRYQKLIEESPSPVLTNRMRRAMGEAAIRIAKEVGYETAGTVEFLVDRDKNFYFMEVNARIQVEHPVTEEVMDLDLIKEQLRTAAGERLNLPKHAYKPRGAAIECRIYAEDPLNDFRPSPGKITLLRLPGGVGVRVDTHIYEGYVIPPYYDSLLAKVITHGRDRQEAIMRMIRAMEEFEIEGVTTTIPLCLQVLNNEKFQRGEISTHFIDEILENWE